MGTGERSMKQTVSNALRLTSEASIRPRDAAASSAFATNKSLRVLEENRVLRRIPGPKREEVVGGCRRLHNEELHKLYTSPNIIRVIKSRMMRWAGDFARMGEMRTKYVSENLKGNTSGKT
jgi:hypothetical protein